MVRISKMIAPLIVFSLLARAATASAECAWVLWSNFISSNPTSRYAPSTGGLWTSESAGTRAECERDRNLMRTNMLEHQAMGSGTQPLAKGTGRSVSVVGPNGQTILTCLPDTIDPRGVKGGG